MDYSRENLIKQGYNEAQIYEITRGIQQKLPIIKIARKEYNWMQMYEIRKGLQEKVDVSQYSDPLFLAQEMREIRLGLLDGLDVSQYARFYYSRSDMKKMRHKLFRKKYSEKMSGFGRDIYDESTGISMRISDDCMSAFLTVPSSGERQFTVIELENVLNKYDIIYGLQRDTLKNVLNKKIFDKEIKVAKGKRIGEKKELSYDLVDGYVMAGQIIAKYKKAERGKTVTGISVGITLEQELPMNVGAGATCDFEKKKYYALRDGYVSYHAASNTIHVWQVKKIAGSLSPVDGEINYEGIVLVKGDVKSGAKVNAAGSIYVEGFAEDAFLTAGDEILIQKGTNGKGKGKIKAGGDIHGKFFELANLEAEGNVKADYFFKCDINAKGIEAKGKKGCIRNCRISTEHEVKASIVENNEYYNNSSIICL